MIQTKSIYSPIDEKEGLRVLITRFYPRGVKREKYDVWVRPLSPSAELLKQYKNSEIDWNSFETMLFLELKENIDSVKAIYTLQTKSRIQNITLLCYEKDNCPCHRYMVRDLIKDPRLLDSKFVPENNHKPAPVPIHISNQC